MPSTKPPPPPIMNLRFHCSGSSRVKRISRPTVPFTLQYGTVIVGGAASGVAGNGAGVFAGTATASVIVTSGSCSAFSAAHSAGVALGRPPSEACPANSSARTALTLLLLLRGGGRRGRHGEGNAGVHHFFPRLIAPRHLLGRIR